MNSIENKLLTQPGARQVIYLSSAILPNRWANSYQTIKTCEALRRQGVDIELWALGKDNSGQMAKAYGVSDISFLRILNKKFPGGMRPSHLTYSFKILKELRIIDRKDLILYSRETVMWLVLLFAKIFWGVPYVFEIHRKKSLTFYDQARRTLVVKFASGLVVISRALLDFYKNKNKNIRLAYCGVDPARFETSLGAEDEKKFFSFDERLIYLGYIGGFEDYQGLPVLLRAFSEVSASDKNLRLAIAGGKENEIERLKNTLSPDVFGKVKFLGHIPLSDVPRFQKAVDILILPFCNMDAGGSPVKMFEYMFARCPIVAADTPMIREVLNDSNALFFKAGNARDLASKIKKILGDKDLQASLSSGAFLDKEKYTFDARASAIKNVLENIK